MNFDGLNYTMANEDSSVEMEILPFRCESVLSIAGSGSRIIPLLARYPENLTVIDKSSYQLALTRLRLESLKALNLDSYKRFWGYSSAEGDESWRKEHFDQFVLADSEINILRNHFETSDWDRPIYLGKWESTITTMSRSIKLILGSRINEMFEISEPQKLTPYFRESFPKRRWDVALKILGKASVFKSLMYGDNFPKLNLESNDYDFYKNSLKSSLDSTLPRNNFFLDFLINGKVEDNISLPAEVEQKIYADAKSAILKCKINFVQNDLDRFLSSHKQEFDFISTSDIHSYLSPEHHESLMKKVQKSLNKKGLCVSRYYRFHPGKINEESLCDVTPQYDKIIKSERTGFYHIEVHQNNL